jgi:hypothetical protein
VAASTPVLSMVNFSTGADKRRWGAMELRARLSRRRKGVRGKENE